MKLGPLGIPMKPAEDEPGTEAWSQLTNLDEWLAYKDVSRIHNLTRVESNHEEEEEEEGCGEEGIVNIGSPTLGDVAAVDRKEDEDQGGGGKRAAHHFHGIHFSHYCFSPVLYPFPLPQLHLMGCFK